MKVNKRVIDSLSKCYAVAPLQYNGRGHIIVAAEKKDPCFLYDMDGVKEDTVWTEPGGTMSIVQIPDSNGEFLATHQFYSANASLNAKIVYVKHDGKKWKIRTLIELPFIHRFDIISRNGINYLFACTLKSDHRYKDDWSSPGKVYAGILPRDIDKSIDEKTFYLEIVKDNLQKNHGYTRDGYKEMQTAIVSAENGVFRFVPPENSNSSWTVEQFIDTPASDAVLTDLNNDGKKEMLVISPFHGDKITIYEQENGAYQQRYVYPEPAEFSHAITCGKICGKEVAIVGHRKGKRNLLLFSYDSEKKEYTADIVDHDTGAANVCLFKHNGKDILVSANREIDEIAVYEFTP